MFTLEVQYFILFAAILLLPKMLLRFRIPTALTSLALGIATAFFLGWFKDDQLLLMLSRLGITSLFLFAGMEVDLDELRDDSSVLLKQIIKLVLIIFVAGAAMTYVFDITYRLALVLALGIMTPSTGFILNSLKNYELTPKQEKWVRSKAIAMELVAIFLLFFILQTESVREFTISTVTLVTMILILPLAFRFFLKVVAPFAPDSEVSFLVLIALLCGVITMKLGTYYLVGAFIVGMTAARFRHFIHHEKSDRMLYSLGLFFSFFVPFYFYRAGLTFPAELFSVEGLIIGATFLVIFLPIRFFSVFSTVWLFMKESWKNRIAIAIPLLPTLIFGLVIASIMREKFGASNELVSGLIIYTLGSSIIPWFFMEKTPPDSYDGSMVR